MSLVLANADLFDGHRRRPASVVINDGRITAVLGAGEPLPGDTDVVDLNGMLLAPGFVDVQVNGGGGVMFNNDRSVETLSRMVAGHRRYGSTTLIPTLITDTPDIMRTAADAVEAAMAARLPGIRGIHFEGPCLSPKRPGVHDPNLFLPLDQTVLPIYARPGLGRVVVTLAPEQVPPVGIAALADNGVLVCAGHTAATYAEVGTALQAGLRGFTHLYNAMTPMTNREPGVVGAALDDDGSWCGLIADGFHLHDATARNAIRAKARGKVMLVTDAMGTVGADDKVFELYGKSIRASGGKCTLEDGTLAGSDLDMATAVRNCHRNLGVPLEETLRMASLYPAQFLKLDDEIGRVEPGYCADLVALDPETLTVRQTWIAGAPDPNLEAAA